MSSKPYGYLLSVERNSLVFLNTENTEFYEIILTFTDRNGRPLEIEEKVDLAQLPQLLIGKTKL